MRTSLYRHFNEDGLLLYVGISLNHIARLGQHSKKAHWFDTISRVEIEHFPDRLSAEKAEYQAIRDEKPLHNIRGVDTSKGFEKYAHRIEQVLAGLSASDRAEVLKPVPWIEEYSEQPAKWADVPADREPTHLEWLRAGYNVACEGNCDYGEPDECYEYDGKALCCDCLEIAKSAKLDDIIGNGYPTHFQGEKLHG